MSGFPDRMALGSLAQLAGVDEFRLDAGPAAGQRVWRVRSGGGLTVDLLCDRAFDIGRVEVAGRQIAWWSPLGFARAGSHTPASMEWLDHFSGGLLTTCGLRSVGSPSAHRDVDWPLHGAITHRAAEWCAWGLDPADQGAIICQAAVREASSLGPDLLMRRELRFPLGTSRIVMADSIVNEGYEGELVQVLYHLNLGWPLSMKTASWEFDPAGSAVELGGSDGVDSAAASASVEDGESRIFRHHSGVAGDRARVTVAARTGGPRAETVSMSVRYSRSELPALWQWIDRRPGRNVVAIEPALGSVEGRASAAAEGLIDELEPGASRSTHLELDLSVGTGPDA